MVKISNKTKEILLKLEETTQKLTRCSNREKIKYVQEEIVLMEKLLKQKDVPLQHKAILKTGLIISKASEKLFKTFSRV